MSPRSTPLAGSRVRRSCGCRTSRSGMTSTWRGSCARRAAPGSTCRPTICSCSRGIQGSTPRSIRAPGWQCVVSTISSIPTPGRLRGVSVSSSRERCPMKRPFVKISIGAGALLFGLLIVPQACTNLDETPLSLITPGNFFHTEPEVLAGLAGVYAQLRSTAPEGGLYDANEVSTDEIVVPIRGKDWNDNGQWIDLHNVTWTPTSAAASNFFNGDWNSAYTGVARANLFIASVEPLTVPNKATYLAEGRALRAFYYYILMDFFGGVPIVTDPTDHALHARNTRREVFDFIERELIAARDSGLPATWDPANNGRFTKGAADAILANMYLNAGVFTKDGTGASPINATGYNSCSGVTVSGGQGACAAAIARADSIL